MIPDYSNLKMNLEGINTFFKDNGVNISAKDRDMLNSIFKECDTTNANGENKADGELTGKEREGFLQKIKSLCPNIYQKVEDFYTVVDVVEGLREKQEEK